MRHVELGFQLDHTLSAFYDLPQKRYATQAAIDTFTDSLLGNLRQLPGVKAAGITSLLPGMGDDGVIAITVEGYIPRTGAELSMAAVSLMQGDSLQALEVRLLRGRFLRNQTRQILNP